MGVGKGVGALGTMEVFAGVANASVTMGVIEGENDFDRAS